MDLNLMDSHPINWTPLEVVSIKRESGRPAKYVLNYEGLKGLLEPIKDKEVAVIPIVGPSRQGKSFILNYMIRYLSDSKSINWIGENNEPLKGFGWKSDVDPQTMGLWISDPFILKQSNGKEIAVLLIDTQGVFDSFSTQRDWSTIVGISLLLSSSLIFNLFTNLQEDSLITLESFLQYGLMAAKANPGSEDEKPFQNLMFLIRDWNYPAKYKFGLTGGKEFLKYKLEVNANHSESAKVVRKQLSACFKDVSCFLMPKIGDKAEEEDFDGSVDGLSDRFVEKMKEFIIHLLNPEDLKPKTIDNNIITGGELLQYFQTYVNIFNSDELPKPTDLVEATAKTKDFISLNKLKDIHLNELKTFIKSKPFVSRKSLEEQIKLLNNQTKQNFDGLKKSTNKEILKELYEFIDNNLKANYEQIMTENESRRIKLINKMAYISSSNFAKLIGEVMASTFLESDTLDDYLRKFKQQVIQEFKQSFGDEEEELFATDLNKLNKEIENFETSFKNENRRRILEANKINSEAVEQSIEFYRKAMKSVLEDNDYLTKKEFKRLEKKTEAETKLFFENNCSKGDQQFKNKFFLEFEQKLSKSKDEFKEQNTMKCERVVSNTERLVTTSVEEYDKRMNNMFDSFTSVEELSESHEEIKKKSFDQFNHSCLYKNDEFLREYLDQLNDDIDASFHDLKTKFTERMERLLNSFNTKVTEGKESYIREMDGHFEDNDVFTDEELHDLHEKALNEAIDAFERHSIVVTNGFDDEKYSNDLKRIIDEELEKYVQKNQINRDLRQRDLKDIVNEYLESYEGQIEAVVDVANSELEVIQRHEDIKRKIISEFKQKAVSTNVSEFESHLEKLDEKIESSLKDAIDILGLHITNQESVSKNLKADVRKYYRIEMEKYYRKTSFLSKEKLIKNSESVLKRTSDKFESERGIMALDNYRKLIEDSVKDIYEKIVAENDMNAPTLPVIGIDLGTTNSCVAYYKADRRSASSVVVIPNELGRNVTPSMVSIRSEGKVVGDVAKEEIRSYPHNTIFSAKRLIGRNFSDALVKEDMKLWTYNVVDDGFGNPKVKVLVNGTEESYFAEQISAEVLKKMKEIAENHLGLKVSKAVITVPAYFNDAQKEATKDAGKIAGLEVLKIINEPTAAALAFQLNKSDEYNSRKVLIYDFGGGTFDVAILNVIKGEIKVLGVGGDNHLGGDNFDTKLVEHCLSEFRSETGYDVSKSTPDGAVAITRLRRVCEENKCKLSSTDTTTIVIDNFYQSEDLRVELTRDKFEELNEEYFVKSMDLVVQTLQDAGLDQSEIDDIVLVGGSTRIPRIQDLLSDQFGGRPLNHTVNPDEAVAVGAAIQAAIINGEKAQDLGHLRVVDVAPMSLGIKVKDGFMSVIIPRNSSVPNTYERIYETVSDYQTTVDVEVFEGEDQKAENNRSLGKFELKGIPAAPKGEQTIKVLFEVTDEGILRVTANIVSTGGEQEIEIKEHKGRLSDQELQQLIDQGN